MGSLARLRKAGKGRRGRCWYSDLLARTGTGQQAAGGGGRRWSSLELLALVDLSFEVVTLEHEIL